MKSLNLRPLPTHRPEEPAASAPVADGFVDEEVLMALVAGPLTTRTPADPDDLVLAADGDFAGWFLPTAAFFEPGDPASRMVESRRPSPPDWEPGLGAPHQGAHRWWIAGLAGALCTLLFSTLLVSLSEQTEEDAGNIPIIRVPAKAQTVPGEPAPSPQLTASPSAADLR